MFTYSDDVKTTLKDAAGNKAEESTVIAAWTFEGPKDEAEFNSFDWTKGETVVNTTTPSGKAGQDKVSNYEAWKYGMTMKANALGRKLADLAIAVEDHIIEKGGKKTDLDKYGASDLAQALNQIETARGMGLAFGKINDAKIADATEKAIAANMIVKSASGTFEAVKGGNGKVVRK